MSRGLEPRPYAASTCTFLPAALTSPVKCRRKRFGPTTVRSYLPSPPPVPIWTDAGHGLVACDGATVYWPGNFAG